MNFIHTIKRTTEALIAILTNPKNLYYVLNNEDYFQNKVVKEFKIERSNIKTISFSDLQISFPQELSIYSYLGGTSSPTDLILLKGLARRFDKCNYFEIGTWRGESIANLEKVTHQRATLNLAADDLNRLGYDAHHIEALNHYIKDDHTIKKLLGNSQTYDFSSIHEKYDLIFIDGDHRWSSVQKDTENVFNHLIHDKSIIVWHDLMKNFSTIWWEVLYGILKGLSTPSRSKIYHVRNTNCLVYLPFEITANRSNNPYLPESTYAVKVDQLDKL